MKIIKEIKHLFSSKTYEYDDFAKKIISEIKKDFDKTKLFVSRNSSGNILDLHYVHKGDGIVINKTYFYNKNFHCSSGLRNVDDYYIKKLYNFLVKMDKKYKKYFFIF